ncbi:hypothetical protein NUSPORA_01241 [Nucleospora cyclopteri]
MTNCKKLYKIKMPFSLDEYRRGMKYVLYKMTTNEVKIIKMHRKKAVNKIITETHKELDLTGRMPYIVKKVIPGAACFVDEFSINIDILFTKLENIKKEKIHQEIQTKQNGLQIDQEQTIELKIDEEMQTKQNEIQIEQEIMKSMKELKSAIQAHENLNPNSMDHGHSCITKYKNKYFDENTFKMKIETVVNKNPDYKINGYDKVEEIDFRDFGGKKISKVEKRDYSGSYDKKYECCYVYKGIDIEINSFGLGWISKEINKALRNMLVEFLQTIVETHSEWIQKSEEDLDGFEQEVLKKILSPS